MDPKILLIGRAGTIHAKRSLLQGRQWLRARGQECLHCRACERPVSPFETTCPHCGAANPARISLSTATLLGLFGLPALIGLYYLFGSAAP